MITHVVKLLATFLVAVVMTLRLLPARLIVEDLPKLGIRADGQDFGAQVLIIRC